MKLCTCGFLLSILFFKCAILMFYISHQTFRLFAFFWLRINLLAFFPTRGFVFLQTLPSPLPCVMEARTMQSCSMSSLGRWSMEVLTGKRERGFFFFSKSAAAPEHTNSKAGLKPSSYRMEVGSGCRTVFVSALHRSRHFGLGLNRSWNPKSTGEFYGSNRPATWFISGYLMVRRRFLS